MAILIAVTSDTFAYDMASGNTLIVPDGVVISFDGNHVVSGIVAPVTVIVDGTVAGGTSWAVGLGGGRLDVGAAGRILSAIDSLGSGVWFGNSDGLSDVLTNRGLIDGALGTGVEVLGASPEVQNAGVIRGQHTGISVLAVGASVSNTGTISGGVPDATDTLMGSGSALQIFGDFARVSNDGLVLAVAQSAPAIRLGSSLGTEIFNSGTLQALRGFAVDASDNGLGFTLDNAGRIIGQDGAVLGSSDTEILANSGILETIQPEFRFAVSLGAGADTFRNAGTVLGRVDLGAGSDRFDGRGGSVSAAVYVGADGDSLIGGGADDWLDGGTDAAADTIAGGGGDDSLIGGGGSDALRGGSGDDTLDGGDLSDLLFGGTGLDRLLGGASADTLRGGSGADEMSGGSGADRFVFAAADEAAGDRITDFVPGSDKIDLSAFMAGGTFIGAAGFSGAVQLRYLAATGLLIGDSDGDRQADWSLHLATRPVLSASDILF